MAGNENKIYAWTPMIRMSDMRYPVYLSDFRNEHKNVSMGDWVWEESMGTDFQYFVVRDSKVPSGDVVTEGNPEKSTEGLWYKTWTSRDYTESEISYNLSRAKEGRRSSAAQLFYSELQAGVSVEDHMFPAGSADLSTLQTIKSFAENNPDQDILLLTGNSDVVVVPAADAKGKIEEIIALAGSAHQRMAAYINSVNGAESIPEIPDVPLTFME